MACHGGRGLRARWSVLLALTCCSCITLHKLDEDDCAGDCKYPLSKVCHKPTMHALACDVDHLEKHIDKYGSVVAKIPDVWGESRLTKYREEFEKEMFKEFDEFKPTLQGSIWRSDQAYFANAFALSAAVSSGQQASSIAPQPRVVVQNSTAQGQTTVTPERVKPLEDLKLQEGVFKGFDEIKRTPLLDQLKFGFGEAGKTYISLEPTILLDQKARYLDHLNQIRRNNE